MKTLEKVTNAELKKHMPMVRKIALKLIAKLPANVERDDLVQVGMIALAESLSRFETAKMSDDAVASGDTESAFLRFTGARIKGSMIDHLRSQDHLSRPQRTLIKRIALCRAKLEHQGGRVTNKAIAERLGITEQGILECEGHAVLITTGTLVDDKDEQSLIDGIPACTESGALDITVESLDQKQRWHRLTAAIETLPQRTKEIVQLHHFEEVSQVEIGRRYSVTESRVCQILHHAAKVLKTLVKRTTTHLAAVDPSLYIECKLDSILPAMPAARPMTLMPVQRVAQAA